MEKWERRGQVFDTDNSLFCCFEKKRQMARFGLGATSITHFATQNVKMTFWVGGWVFKILFDVLRGSLFLEDKIP